MKQTAILSIVASIGVASALGCTGSNHPQTRLAIDEMQLELLAMEDRYLELEHKYLLAQRELHAFKTQQLAQKPQAAGNTTTHSGNLPETAPDSHAIPEVHIELDPPIGTGSPSSRPDSGMQQIDPKDLELKSPKFGPTQTPSTLENPNSNKSTSTRTDSIDELNIEIPNVQTAYLHDLPTARLSNQPITHIRIHPKYTGGIDRDSDGVDDELQVFIQPVDNRLEPVPKSGPVTISLIDPAEQNDLQRIGLWKLSQEEVAESLTSDGRGMLFNFAWPDKPPTHRDLLLFVRYVDANGDYLEASQKVQFNVAGDVGPIVPNAADPNEGFEVAPITNRSDSQLSGEESEVPNPESVFVPRSPSAAIGRLPAWRPQR